LFGLLGRYLPMFVGGKHVASNQEFRHGRGTKSERLLNLRRWESSRIGTSSGRSPEHSGAKQL
jgi:hypothetical protein